MQNVKCKIDVDSFGIFDCENSDSMWNEPPTVGWEEAVMLREHRMLKSNQGKLRESARGGSPTNLNLTDEYYEQFNLPENAIRERC